MRYWFSIIVALMVIGLISAIAVRRNPISPAAFERIRNGMSRAEVEQVVGFPPHRVEPELVLDLKDPKQPKPVLSGRIWLFWSADGRFVQVVVNAADQVVEKHWSDDGARDFLDWVGRQAGL